MKKIIISIILILILFISAITIYKFKYFKEEEKHYYVNFEIKNKKKDLVDSDVLDNITYKDKIITENLLSTNYNFFDDKQSITGKIYIDEKDKNLYITDEVSDSIFKVATTKFKTMYVKDYEYETIYIYLISEDDKLYFLELSESDITKVHLEEITVNYKITNFVDLDFESDMYQPGNTIFVLAENGKIYDIGSATRYREDITSIFNNIYVYGDKTMSNVYGYMLEDGNNNYYKIKNVLYITEKGDFLDENTLVIITEDNKLLLLEGDGSYVYEFDQKIKNINSDIKYPYVDGNITITFEDEYKVDLVGRCSQYYCMNEFVE